MQCARCEKAALPNSDFCAEHQPRHLPEPGGRKPPPRGARTKDSGYGVVPPVQQTTVPVETPDQLARRLQKLAPRKTKRKRK
jgi:hypothetical protein